ncbi:MAG: hypothetical protein Q9209_002120 [Squamulea sp. 1 TL-2023]
MSSLTGNGRRSAASTSILSTPSLFHSLHYHLLLTKPTIIMHFATIFISLLAAPLAIKAVPAPAAEANPEPHRGGRHRFGGNDDGAAFFFRGGRGPKGTGTFTGRPTGTFPGRPTGVNRQIGFGGVDDDDNDPSDVVGGNGSTIASTRNSTRASRSSSSRAAVAAAMSSA